jgi:hypothetical protein
MQMPPVEPIPPLPDDTTPGPVPPLGPTPEEPDEDDWPLPDDDPGDSPHLPPSRNPFPDDVEPPAEHPESL